MEQCELCNGLRGHQRLKNVMCEYFEDEYKKAQRECDRLNELFKDVCWYNFETVCRKWSYPWQQSWEESLVELRGLSLRNDRRNGRDREIGEFPIYFQGEVRDAPPLPPQIILTELKLASEHLEECLINKTAPTDWEPGGPKYNELLRTTSVPNEYSKKKEKVMQIINSKRSVQYENGPNKRQCE